MIFGPFEEKNHGATIWRGNRAIISFILTEQIFIYFYCHGDQFYDQYINETDKKIILMIMVLG